MDGSAGIQAENAAVEKTLKTRETNDLDVLETLDLEPVTNETEATRDVDNDLVRKDAVTANIFQTERVRIAIDPARDANLTAFGR